MKGVASVIIAIEHFECFCQKKKLIKLVISIYSAYKSTVVSVTVFPSVRELTCENDLQVITANSLLTHTNREFFSFALCLAIVVIINTAAKKKSKCTFCGHTQLRKKKNRPKLSPF